MSNEKNETVEKVDPNFLDNFFGDTTEIVSDEELNKQKIAINAQTMLEGDKEFEFNILDPIDETVSDEQAAKDKAEKEALKIKAQKEKKADEDEDRDENEIANELHKKEEIDAFSVIEKLIEDKKLLAFEDQEIKTAADLEELIFANLQHAKAEPIEQFKEDFFAGLPQEVRIAYEYSQKGATSKDIKSLFKNFSELDEVSSLDISTEKGQKEIIKSYLLETKFGTEDEIDQEIEDWMDLDKLEDKASKFLPKLEKLRESSIAQKLEAQREQERNQIEFKQKFVNNVISATDKPQFINLKLPKQERISLQRDMLENNYVSQLTGRPVNALGNVLEDISFVNPNPEFLAEIVYFATKPEEFMKNITEQLKEKEMGNTIKKLKTTTLKKSTASGTAKTVKYRNINELN